MSMSVYAGSKKLLLIETQHDPFYNYEGLRISADCAGFKTSIAHFYQLPEDMHTYDAVFILMSDYFLFHMFDVPIFKHMLDQVTQYAQLSKQKIVGLIFPHHTVFEKNTVNQTKHFLSEFKLYPYSYTECTKSFLQRVWYGKRTGTECFIKVFLQYLLQPSHPAFDKYHTNLLYNDKERKKNPPLLEDLSDLYKEEGAYVIPTKKDMKFSPLGLMIKQDQTYFFISKMSWLDNYEINENFRTYPLEKSLQAQFFATLQETLKELHALLPTTEDKPAKGTHTCRDIPSLNRTEKKKYQNLRTTEIDKRYTWMNTRGINGAWLELEPYVKTPELLQKGVDSILDAHLNMLWMSLSPERFFSRLVTDKEKEKAEFLAGLTLFTKKLKEASAQRKTIPPAFFVGSEITTNFGKNPVSSCVYDMTGKKLDKIPAPFDWDNFWYPELIQPFMLFVDQWQKGVGSGLSLAGIFLDLEMYHAQDQASEYTNMMDFGDHTWQLYGNRYPEKVEKTLKTVPERVDFLIKNDQLPLYYSFLQSEAQAIGKKIREHIRARLPEAIIGVYSMTLPHTWFLLGMLAGLSTPTDPLILATFNVDAYRHFDYLRKNHIYCFHIPVFLLSKLRAQEDFSLINQLRSAHDGVWFNRFSRLVETLDDKVWWNLEASPLERSIVAKGIGKSF